MNKELLELTELLQEQDYEKAALAAEKLTSEELANILETMDKAAKLSFQA